jgi:thymidylate synthase
MALVPCLLYYQFYVSSDKKKLSLFALMRSADLFLGVPWNICSCSLLLYIVAHCTNLEPYEVKLQFVDCHVYSNHIEAAKTQMERKPFQFPRLKPFRMSSDEMKSAIGMNSKHEFTLSTTDFEMENNTYVAHPPIKAEMAV